MSCQRPHAGIVLSTEKHHLAIGIEMMPVCMKVAETVFQSVILTTAGCHIRLGLYLLSCGKIVVCQDGYLSDDTVPVGLSILCICMTAGINLCRHPASVIHDDGEMMSASL